MSLPTFKPGDLRDHADPARIDRVWSRLEAELPAAAEADRAPVPGPHRAHGGWGPWATARSGRRTRTALLVAASLAAFGGGLLVGRTTGAPEPSTQPVATATHESFDAVLAAGSRTRTFSLPGGGSVTLLPGGTMEVADVDGGVVSLRLVQGEASLETAGGGTVAIAAGDARVSTIGASTLTVRRDERAIDVSVADGLVEIDAPDGRRTLRPGDRHTASTVVTTAVVAPTHRPEPPVRAPSEPPPLRNDETAPEPAPAPLDPPAPATPGWFALYQTGKIAEARALLPPAEMAPSIERARSADELMALDHFARSQGEMVLAMRALSRVVTEFPDNPYAKVAAVTLGNLHRSAGNHALAAQYDELAKSSQFAEDIACRRIGALDARDPSAAQTAKDYLAKYPQGRCRTAAEDLLSDAEADASEPREDGADDAEPPVGPPATAPAAPPAPAAPSPPAAPTAP